MTSIVLELPEDKVGRVFPDGITMNIETVPQRGDKVLVRVEDGPIGAVATYVVTEVRHELRARTATKQACLGVVVVRLAAPGDT